MTTSTLIARMILVVSMVVAVSLPASADSEQPWRFGGGGWGHGVGLSQFGALGQAEDGAVAAEILRYYYGADSYVGELSTGHFTNEAEGLAVGLVAKTGSVRLGAVGAADIRICQPSSDCSQVDELVTTTDTWRFEINQAPENPEDPPECRVRRGSGASGQNWGWGLCDAKVTQAATTSTRIVLDGTEYARGTLFLTPAENGFHAVLRLTLENYLYGLAEMPSDWPHEALKAQAIIGRTFAVTKAEARDGSGFWEDLCGCHIRDTSADQVYIGWSKEGPAWNAAVDGSVTQVLKHPDSWLPLDLVETFYSSSNGGASENNEDVWGGTPRPWLRSVVDPWSADPDVNPLAQWEVLVNDADLADYFGWDRALDAFVIAGPPGALIKFTGKDNGSDVSETLNGTEVRGLLNSLGYLDSGGTVRVSPYIASVVDPPGFDDIVGHLFESDIDWALAQGITKGCNPPDNTFYCPSDSVSREVMAAFLKRALDLPSATSDYFTDDEGSIFEADINALAQAGITKGCGEKRFCPKDLVDRGQMAAFLVRALKLTDDGGGDLFVDDDASIFEHDIDVLGTAGITRGCNPPTNDRFCPNRAVDRGQMAAFLRRAIEDN